MSLSRILERVQLVMGSFQPPSIWYGIITTVHFISNIVFIILPGDLPFLIFLQAALTNPPVLLLMLQLENRNFQT